MVNVDNVYACDVFLQEFIEDIKTIKVKPKFPKEGTKYYFIAKDNSIYDLEFSESATIDVLDYKIGIFFLSEEEAEQNKEKFMKILNSPEKFNIKE